MTDNSTTHAIPEFYPWATPYSDTEADRLIKAAPEHLTEDVRQLIAAVNEAHKTAKKFLTTTGVWYHASPGELAEGTVLVPGGPDGSTHAAQEFYADTGLGSDTGMLADMGAPRTAFVWITPHRDDAEFWAGILDADHLYEVEPRTDPLPWNGTAADGWVCDSAVIIRRVSTS